MRTGRAVGWTGFHSTRDLRPPGRGDLAAWLGATWMHVQEVWGEPLATPQAS